MVDYCGKGCLFFYNLIYLVRINFLFEFLLFLSFSGEKDIFKNMGYKREWMWGTHFFEAWNYNWKEKHESFTLTVSTMFYVLVKRNLIFNLAFVIEKLGTVLFYPEICKETLLFSQNLAIALVIPRKSFENIWNIVLNHNFEKLLNSLEFFLFNVGVRKLLQTCKRGMRTFWAILSFVVGVPKLFKRSCWGKPSR